MPLPRLWRLLRGIGAVRNPKKKEVQPPSSREMSVLDSGPGANSPRNVAAWIAQRKG